MDPLEAEADADVEVAQARARVKRRQGGGSTATAAPGDSPETALPDMPPEVTTGDRASLQYRSRDAGQLAERITSEKGLEARPTSSGNVAIKSPSTGKWHVLDEPGFNWRDILDVGGEAQDVAASVGGGLLGLIPGGGVASLATGVAGAAAGGAASKGLRTGSVQGAKEGAVEGALGELGGAAISKGLQYARMAYKGAGRGAEVVSQALEAPARVQEVERGLASLEPGREAVTAQRARLRATGAEVSQEAQRLANAQARTATGMAEVGSARAAERARTAPVYAERDLASAEMQKLEQQMIQEVKARGANVSKVISQGAAISGSVGSTGTKAATSRAGRTLISELLPDPAWGFKAEFLDQMPELQEILRRNFGDQIVPELGTRAMRHRNDFLKLIKDIDPKGYETKAESYVLDMAHYLIGSAEFKAMSAAEKASLLKVAQGTASQADAKAFQSAMRGKLSQAAKVTPEMSAASERLGQARAAAAGAKAEESSADIAYKSNLSDLRARQASLRGEAEALGPRRMGISTAKTDVERGAAKIAAERGVLKGELASIPHARLGQALMGVGTTALGGAIGGTPGAIVGATLGASGSLAIPMRGVAQAIRWISRRPNVMTQALITRLPKEVQGVMQQVAEVFRKHGEKAAAALLQALIRANPDLEEKISQFVR